MPSPKKNRDMQKLAGLVAELNQFIPKSSDRCIHFFMLLKGSKTFIRDDKCETAFQDLKRF